MGIWPCSPFLNIPETSLRDYTKITHVDGSALLTDYPPHARRLRNPPHPRIAHRRPRRRPRARVERREFALAWRLRGATACREQVLSRERDEAISGHHDLAPQHRGLPGRDPGRRSRATPTLGGHGGGKNPSRTPCSPVPMREAWSRPSQQRPRAYRRDHASAVGGQAAVGDEGAESLGSASGNVPRNRTQQDLSSPPCAPRPTSPNCPAMLRSALPETAP